MYVCVVYMYAARGGGGAGGGGDKGHSHICPVCAVVKTLFCDLTRT